ncbi:MAG: hypothetical protein SVJ22_11695 [Halobacteriota archaeon]|nr:hypothetical protein [Halobacteriota archaeon]
MEKHVSELEEKLAKCKNLHTPPSAQRFKKMMKARGKCPKEARCTEGI